MSERLFSRPVKRVLPPADSHLYVGLKNENYADVVASPQLLIQLQ